MRRSTANALAGIGLGALLLTGCSVTDGDADATGTVSDQTTESSDTATDATTTEDTQIDVTAITEATSIDDLGIEEVDLAYDTADATTITLADGASSVDGAGASVDGDTVTITESGTYVLSGSLSAGQVVVDGDKADVTLVLDGVDITAADVAGINVVDADWVVLALADGSTNAVSDAAGATESDEEDAPNAAIYSTADLWITGGGSLSVTGVAADGITSKDSLVVDSGTVTVTATDDGIRGKDHLVIQGGDLAVDSGGDSLKSDNEADADDASALVGRLWIAGGTLTLTSEADAMDAYNQLTISGGDVSISAGDDAVHADGILRITDGTIDVSTSNEGLEGGLMYLDGGTGTIVSTDDGLNASDGSGSSSGMGGGMGGEMPSDGQQPSGADDAQGSATTTDSSSKAASATASATVQGATVQTAAMPGEEATDAYLEITGGSWFINAGGDGVDSNGSVLMTGGTVVVAGPTNSGNGAVDYAGTFEIDGGTFVATGASGMAQEPDEGSQAVIGISLGDTISAGTAITVTDADGTVVASIDPAKETQTLVVSTPDLVEGNTYTVAFGGEVTGTDTFGLITEGTLTGGESAGTIEAS
ncbi:MAG: carbohydrate-binding domain-containing protein [Demequina sp.]|uniref:carbohydrate-binding domain-containing protein n=1 Tax=Demequina sp. TaxID=2050685 RepID=UPI003A8BE5B2